MVLKRKHSVHTSCIDPKKTNAPNKPATKADLAADLKLMRTLNNALEDEIKKKTEAIEDLEMKVVTLKN